MGKSKRLLLVIISPVVICILLTIIGLSINKVALISFSGLTLMLICFTIFALVSRAIVFAQNIREKYLSQGNESYSFFRQDIAPILNLLAGIPLHFAILIRTTFLSVSFWLADFYVSLCEGGLEIFREQILINLIQTILVMALGSYDTFRKKTIDDSGMPTRISSIWGAFQYYRNFLILLAAFVQGTEALVAAKGFLTNPLWFLDNDAYLAVWYALLSLMRKEGGTLLELLLNKRFPDI